jgi:hypothetical protein
MVYLSSMRNNSINDANRSLKIHKKCEPKFGSLKGAFLNKTLSTANMLNLKLLNHSRFTISLCIQNKRWRDPACTKKLFNKYAQTAEESKSQKTELMPFVKIRVPSKIRRTTFACQFRLRPFIQGGKMKTCKTFANKIKEGEQNT